MDALSWCTYIRGRESLELVDSLNRANRVWSKLYSVMSNPPLKKRENRAFTVKLMFINSKVRSQCDSIGVTRKEGKSVDAVEPWHAGITCTSAGIRVFGRPAPLDTLSLPVSTMPVVFRAIFTP